MVPQPSKDVHEYPTLCHRHKAVATAGAQDELHAEVEALLDSGEQFAIVAPITPDTTQPLATLIQTASCIPTAQ